MSTNQESRLRDDGRGSAGGPLNGVRVLDLTRAMPGAVASMLLADYGAEVLVVESPRGTPLRRTAAHGVWNRGKRSIMLDLDVADDCALAVELAAGADVVLEDRRPGALDPFGLGYDDVVAANP